MAIKKELEWELHLIDKDLEDLEKHWKRVVNFNNAQAKRIAKMVTDPNLEVYMQTCLKHLKNEELTSSEALRFFDQLAPPVKNETYKQRRLRFHLYSGYVSHIDRQSIKVVRRPLRIRRQRLQRLLGKEEDEGLLPSEDEFEKANRRIRAVQKVHKLLQKQIDEKGKTVEKVKKLEALEVEEQSLRLKHGLCHLGELPRFKFKEFKPFYLK